MAGGNGKAKRQMRLRKDSGQRARSRKQLDADKRNEQASQQVHWSKKRTSTAHA